MGRELPYIAAINEAIHLEMARDERVVYFGQNLATTEDDEFVKAFGHDRVRVRRSRRRPRSGWPSGRRSPACGQWSSCTWPSSCSWR